VKEMRSFRLILGCGCRQIPGLWHNLARRMSNLVEVVAISFGVIENRRIDRNFPPNDCYVSSQASVN
jgi:hypothetical protein